MIDPAQNAPIVPVATRPVSTPVVPPAPQSAAPIYPVATPPENPKISFLKKVALSTTIALLVIVSVLGFFFYRQSQVKFLGQITLGWNAWPGFLPYLVAYDQGYFKEDGLDVKMIEEESYGKMLDDLVSSKIDFAGSIGLIDIAEKDSSGAALKIVSVADYSNGADGIVTKKEIKSISELKGKKVAVEQGTLGEYLLYDALKKNNRSLTDVQEVNMTAQEAAQAFISGKVDAAVSYEPYYSQAVKDGNGWRIYTSADSPGLITDVVALKGDFVTKNPEKVSTVIKSYFKAMDFIAKNPDQAYTIGAKYFKITPSEFKDQYAGIKQVGLTDNLNFMSYGNGSDSLHGLINQAYDFLLLKGTVKNRVDSTEIIDPSFIRGLQK